MTPEDRKARKTRRQVRRFRQEHPHETRPDSLKSGVEFLASLRCDDSTTRQGRLSTMNDERGPVVNRQSMSDRAS